MESVQSSLAAMAELFNSRMNDFQRELNKTSPSAPTTSSLANDFTSFRTFIMAALDTVQRQVEILARNMDRLEMKSRRKMLLFHGIPENKSEDTDAVIASIITNKTQITNFNTDLISRCHRLGRPSEKRSRPIVVKFRDTATRDKIWFSKTKLKGTGVTQSEFLTKSRHSVFVEARQRFGISKCWTMDGCIHVLAPNGSHHRVETIAELEAIASAPLTSSPAQPASEVSRPVINKVVARTKRIIKK